MRSFGLLLIACACALALPAVAGAHPGDVDTTYGAGGRVANVFGGGKGYVQALVPLDDGKVIIGGDAYGSGFALARLNQDGSLDTSFGTAGQVRVPFGAGSGVAGLAIGPNGKIAAVGSTPSPFDWAIAMFNSDGSPDTGFSSDGRITFPFGAADDLAQAVAFLPGGGIAVAGNTYVAGDYDMGVAEWDSTGAPITSFYGSGKHALPIGTADDSAGGIVALPNGNLVVVGTAGYASSVNNIALVRLLPLGTPDASFAGGGIVTKLLGHSTDGVDFVTQADGKYVIGASTQGVSIGLGGFSVIRYNADGTLDTSFGTGGSTTTPILGQRGSTKAMSIEPDGKILLGGDVPITGGFESVLIRYSADGILDPSFGNGGIVLNSFSGSDDEMMALAVQKDGNILAGIGQDLAPAGGSVYRYLAADPVPVALGAKFSTPTKSKLKASKFKSLSGTAEGDGLTRVEVAIGLADAKLLKRSKKCRFVTGANGKTKKYKAVNKKCAPSKWLTATGTTSWSYKFKKKLGPGKYKLYVRAVGTVGAYSPAVSKSLKIVK